MSCDIFNTIIEGGVEGSLIVFLLTLSFKIYKMKIKSHSKCCGEQLEIETENDGGSVPI